MGTIADPACGTGSFFLAAYDFIVAHHGSMDKDEKRFLKFNTLYGHEIVAGTRRLALMNLFLHNIGDVDSDSSISSADALIAPSGVYYDYVLASRPFDKKSSQTFINEEGEQEKEDLTYNRAGLLCNHQQQATELRSAHPLARHEPAKHVKYTLE